MFNTSTGYIVFSALIISLLLFCSEGLAYTGNIDTSDKYAWSENAGWINFRPKDGGVTVYPDHLEGFAWSESLGWIKLGNHDGGGTFIYGNTSAEDWGVNNDGTGNLSGYGWSETSGWINFNPSDSRVTIDPVTGSFDGYAWSESVGWVHFKNSSPAYNVAMLELVKGDLDADGEVGLTDAVISLKLLSAIGINELRRDYNEQAEIDVNRNSRVDLAESVYIMRKIAGH